MCRDWDRIHVSTQTPLLFRANAVEEQQRRYRAVRRVISEAMDVDDALWLLCVLGLNPAEGRLSTLIPELPTVDGHD